MILPPPLPHPPLFLRPYCFLNLCLSVSLSFHLFFLFVFLPVSLFVYLSLCFSSSFFNFHLSSLEVVLVLQESFCASLGVVELSVDGSGSGTMDGHYWS